MAVKYRFNVFTGTFDMVESGSGSGDSLNPDTILTGPTECNYSGPTPPLEVLIDADGNVLIGVL
jgi:hypothetical protein